MNSLSLVIFWHGFRGFAPGIIIEDRQTDSSSHPLAWLLQTLALATELADSHENGL